MSSLWNTFKSYINWKSKETDEEISQVTTLRVVPLPDFVVYPTNATDRTNNNSIHILWEDPTQLPNGDTYNITFSSIPGLVDTKIEQVFELDKPIENYYKEWNFWPIHVISTGASILTVIIMQNLLIAFMTGVYENAKYNVIFSVLGYRADLIADYEMLNKPFGSYRGNPRYIYYVRSSEYQDEWMDKAENYRKTH
ncbi:9434_t:CDS:2, partial [Funneliformis geosporum]